MMEIGRHRLLCGDVTRNDLNILMDGKKADIVYVDPPWNNGIATLFRRWAGKPSKVRVSDFFVDLLEGLKKHSNGVIIADVGEQTFLEFRTIAEQMGAKTIDSVMKTWGENDGVYYTWIGTFTDTDCGWYDSKVMEKYQANTDNEKALEYLLSEWKSYPLNQSGKGIILDPCIGYGLTARLGHTLGLTIYGMELNPKRLAKSVKFLKGHLLQEAYV